MKPLSERIAERARAMMNNCGEIWRPVDSMIVKKAVEEELEILKKELPKIPHHSEIKAMYSYEHGIIIGEQSMHQQFMSILFPEQENLVGQSGQSLCGKHGWQYTRVNDCEKVVCIKCEPKEEAMKFKPHELQAKLDLTAQQTLDLFNWLESKAKELEKDAPISGWYPKAIIRILGPEQSKEQEKPREVVSPSVQRIAKKLDEIFHDRGQVCDFVELAEILEAEFKPRPEHKTEPNGYKVTCTPTEFKAEKVHVNMGKPSEPDVELPEKFTDSQIRDSKDPIMMLAYNELIDFLEKVFICK